MKGSVLIAAYNHGRYIREALQSVFTQTIKDFEIIIIDDGSLDNTRTIIENEIKIRSDFSIKFLFQENQGLSSTRNRAIKESKGDYIAFLDSDDVFYSQKIEKSFQYLDSHPEIAGVYSDITLIDQDGQFLREWLKYKKHFGEGNIYINLIYECFFIPGSVVFRREVFDKVGGFDPNIKSVEDIDMWLRICRSYKVGVIREPLLKWRIHANNTSKDVVLALENIIKVYEKQLKDGRTNKTARTLFNQRLVEKYADLGHHYQEKGRALEAIAQFRKSLQYGFNFKTFLWYLFLLITKGLMPNKS